MSSRTGGPAFPLPFLHVVDADNPRGHFVDGEDAGVPTGLSLRDYFAAKALPMAARAEDLSPTGAHGEPSYSGVAQRAYLFADAMLAAREAQP